MAETAADTTAPTTGSPGITRLPPEPSGAADRAAARAAKLATVTAGLAKLPPEVGGIPAVASGEGKPTTAATGTDAPAAAGAAPDKPKADDKPAAPADDKPDEQTQKGLSLLDKRAKAFRDEQAQARAQLELERSQLVQLKAEIEGRGTSIDDLRKLAKRDPVAALEKLGIQSEDEWEIVGRGAYPRTKQGKADPKAAPAVAQTARERELLDRLDAMERKFDEMSQGQQQRDTRAQQQQFVNNYLDGAVKAIPTDKPTLLGKLNEKSPEKARQALFMVGARMERAAAEEAGALRADGTYRYDPDFTPTHAAVIAEYERARRAELEEQGVDVDALLAAKPAAPATKPATKPAVTLDPSATGGGGKPAPPKTREDKIKAVTAGLQKLQTEAQ